MFLGEDLLAWLVLAIGGAMAVGSVLAIVRPPEQRREGDLEAAPIGRSIVFAVIGAIGAVWALASLISGEPGPQTGVVEAASAGWGSVRRTSSPSDCRVSSGRL
jgi:hypothetical protein